MAHRLAPEAEADLDDIWYFIAEESHNIEVATARLIPSRTGFFFLQPIHTSAAAAMKTCSLACGVFLLASIYRLQAEGVLILRVIRGSRDIEALFRT